MRMVSRRSVCRGFRKVYLFLRVRFGFQRRCGLSHRSLGILLICGLFLMLTLGLLLFPSGRFRLSRSPVDLRHQRQFMTGKEFSVDAALGDIQADQISVEQILSFPDGQSVRIESKNKSQHQLVHLGKVPVADVIKTNASIKVKPGSKRAIFKIVSNNRDCVRIISLYTPSMRPFGYWPEYSELNRLFDKSRKHFGNNESFPAALVECPQHTCDINLKPTDDEGVLVNSDAVVLNVAPLVVRWQMAARSERFVRTLAKDNVKVIFYAMESATTVNTWDNTIKNIKYHYSMTYHSWSDVVLPYGRYVPGKPMDDLKQGDNFPAMYTSGKTSLIAWMASNCNLTFWPRYEWVTSLRALLPIDVYGNCGNATCLPRFSEKCVKRMRSYKFYLALENSQCDEYIMEKFWRNCLLNGVVPVVYGGRKESYERIAPPNSFIYIGDFSSTKELADYLLLLDSDDELYSRYFAWRRSGHIQMFYPKLHPSAFCDIVPLLQGNKPDGLEVKRVGDSGYFKACRESTTKRYTKPGDIKTWTPWQ